MDFSSHIVPKVTTAEIPISDLNTALNSIQKGSGHSHFDTKPSFLIDLGDWSGMMRNPNQITAFASTMHVSFSLSWIDVWSALFLCSLDFTSSIKMSNTKLTSITVKFLACFYCKKYVLLLHRISLKDKKTYVHMSLRYLNAHIHTHVSAHVLQRWNSPTSRISNLFPGLSVREKQELWLSRQGLWRQPDLGPNPSPALCTRCPADHSLQLSTAVGSFRKWSD